MGISFLFVLGWKSWFMKKTPLRVLVVAELLDNTLDCFVSQMVDSEEVDVHILRSKAGKTRKHVTYICPPIALQRNPVLSFLWKILYVLRLGLEGNFSCVCAIFAYPHLYIATLASFLSRKPLFYTVIASEWEFKGVSSVFQKLNEKILRRVSKVFVSGDRAIEYLMEQGIQTKNIVRYSITELVNLDRFIPLGLDRSIDLITLSRLVEGKNIETFIDIVASLRESNPSISAAIIGDGNLRGYFESYATSLGLSKNIRFHGYIPSFDDVNRILNTAKIFVLNSCHEGGPFTVPEAMATGLCVVSSNVGEVASIIDHGYNGFIIETYNDVEAYSRIIKQLLEDHEELHKIQERAAAIKDRRKNRALARFWKEIAESNCKA